MATTQEAARDKLTPRQREVLATIERLGQDNIKEIAAELGISNNGVHGHIRRMRELGAIAPSGTSQNGGSASGGRKRAAGKPRGAKATPSPDPEPPAPDGEINAESVAIVFNAETQAYIAKLTAQAEAVQSEIDRRVKCIEEHQREIEGLTAQSAKLQERLGALGVDPVVPPAA